MSRIRVVGWTCGAAAAAWLGIAGAKPQPAQSGQVESGLKPLTPKVPIDKSIVWKPPPCPNTTTRCRVGADGAAAANQPGFCVARDDPQFGCGTCVRCDLKNVVTARCGAGGCDYDRCQQDFSDQDGVRSNGCEAMLNDPWHFLANGLGGSPMCDGYADRMMCGLLRADGQLVVSHYFQRYFSWPAPLGFAASSGATATSEQTYSHAGPESWPAFRVVAWRGPQQQLVLQDYRNGALVGTSDAGGILVSRPDCAQAAPISGEHRVACVVRGTDDQIWLLERNGAVVSPWRALGGANLTAKTSAGPSIVGGGAHGSIWDIAYFGPAEASGKKPLMVARYAVGSPPTWKRAGEFEVAADSDLNCDAQWVATAAGSFGLHCVFRSPTGDVREVVVDPVSGALGSQWNWGHPHGKPAKFTPYLTHLRGNKALVTVAEGFYSYPGETAVPGDSLWIRELPRY